MIDPLGSFGILLFHVIILESLCSGSIPHNHFVNIITNFEVKMCLRDPFSRIVMILEFSLQNFVHETGFSDAGVSNDKDLVRVGFLTKAEFFGTWEKLAVHL